MKFHANVLALSLIFFGPGLAAEDWPQWRHDANRSGAASEELPSNMSLQWELALGKPAPAYEHQYRMCADFSYAPVAAEGMLFIPSNVTDQVMAFDLKTGALQWRYVTEGPVRFAPVYGKGKLYFLSDDGYLYCVDAKTGGLHWRRRGVPENTPDMLMLVNGRMVSRWPGRGAPVLHNGLVHFGAGVWPEEGVYQNAVNAETGDVVWRSDALSIVKDGMCDHGTNYDLSLPPQGYGAIINGKLAVTSGRTLSAWFDPITGAMDPYTSFYVKFAVPRGAWYVAGNDDFWVQGGNWFGAHSDAAPPKPLELADAGSPLSYSRKFPENANWVMKHRPFLAADKPYGSQVGEGYENSFSDPIITEDTIYVSTFDEDEKYSVYRGRTFVKAKTYDKLVARDLLNPTWVRQKSKGGSKGSADIAAIEFPIKWEMKTSLRAEIKAGSHLIAAEPGRIAAIAIPEAGQTPEIVWDAEVDGDPVNTLAADGMLVTVTDKGTVYCFGDGPASKPKIRVSDFVVQSPKNGYACVLGWGDGRDAMQLSSYPEWRVVVFEKDAAVVASAREQLNAMGLNGRRVQVIHARPGLSITPYWANMVALLDATALGADTMEIAVNSLRPFTGKMVLSDSIDRSKLRALVANKSGYQFKGETLLRVSAPDGAADWTHESAGADNSFVSKDTLVKWPLGVLWYSGDIDRFFTPETHYQHERNPYPLIKDGRMYIITNDQVHAIDVYTGDYFWEAEMPATPYLNTRLFDSRLYGRPTERNYVLAGDLVYCVSGEKIHAFDVVNGEQRREFLIPEQLRAAARSSAAELTTQRIPETGKAVETQAVPEWTELRLLDDLIIARAGHYLFGMDRRTGKLVWSRKTAMDYTVYTIGDGVLYGIDCVPDDYAAQTAQHEKTGIFYALDPADGTLLWERDIYYLSWPELKASSIRRWMKPPMPSLGYNAKHQLLVMAYNGNNVVVSRAKDGSELWSIENPEMEHDARIYSPNILDDHLILSLSKYTGGLGYLVDILTGKKLQEEVQVPKARTCGRLVGNAHLMTYRDAATEIYDIDGERTIPFNSIRAGCTTSLIPANGVLSAPMLGHGCVCNYPMFASYAMYHMPGSDALRPDAVIESWESTKQVN